MAVIRLILSFLFVALLTGCSTYHSHFGRFYGENSAGEDREFLIHWYSEEGQFGDPEDLKVTLKTQCSERVLTFLPSAQSKSCQKAGASHIWCGKKGADLDLQGRAVSTFGHVCGYLKNPEDQSAVSLGKTFELYISCFPATVSRQVGDEQKNTDILKASAAPYMITVKQAEAGTTEARRPVLSAKVCKAKK